LQLHHNDNCTQTTARPKSATSQILRCVRAPAESLALAQIFAPARLLRSAFLLNLKIEYRPPELGAHRRGVKAASASRGSLNPTFPVELTFSSSYSLCCVEGAREGTRTPKDFSTRS